MAKRIQSLQTLRFLAISLVFISHCTFIAHPQGGALFNMAGAFGVSLFICLSGFLTYRAGSSRTRPAPLGEQARGFFRKVGKFYPLHVITFIAAIPLVVAAAGGAGALDQIWIGALNLALLQSWVPSSRVFFSFNAVSWYLSTFLLMIALSPALVGLARKISEGAHGRVTTALLMAGIAAIELAAALALETAPLAQWILYVFPPTRLLDFFAGMLCGVVFEGFQRRPRPSFRTAALAGGVVGGALAALGIAYTAWRGLQTPVLFYSAAWVVPSNLLILFFAAFDDAAALRARPLVLLGNISMEFFLIHQLVLRYAKLWFDTAAQPIDFAIGCYVIAWVLAYAAHRAARNGLPLPRRNRSARR